MFRFTIRELLLLTVIAAIGVGWWIDRSRLVNDLAEFRNEGTFWFRWKAGCLEHLLRDRGVEVKFKPPHTWTVIEDGKEKDEVFYR